MRNKMIPHKAIQAGINAYIGTQDPRIAWNSPQSEQAARNAVEPAVTRILEAATPHLTSPVQRTILTRHISPALIGQHLRIQDHNLDITGQLTDLAIQVKHQTPGTQLACVIATIADHELRLTGNETCTLLGRNK